MNKKFLLILFSILMFFSKVIFSNSLNELKQPEMITNRHHPEAFIKSIKNDPQAGKKIYEQFCSTCHAKDPEIDLKAPRIGNNKDWEPRMKKGVDSLLTVTEVGLNQMPPRGGCFECSDDQLRAAIIYMLPSARKQLNN